MGREKKSRQVFSTYGMDRIEKLGAISSADDVAGVLGCSVQYARRLCANGTLEAVKMGSVWRVRTSSLLEFAGLA